MHDHYEGIDGLRPRLPLGAAVTIGRKGPSGAPIETDRFFFVSPVDSMEGKYRIRPQLPQFAAFNGAEVAKRQMIRGNLVHSRREECFAHHLRAQVLAPLAKWPAHPQKRPACTGDGETATRYFGTLADGSDDFREIPCPNDRCEFRQGAVKLCKPFAQLLFRPRWPEGNPLPTPLTKLTTGSWHSSSALLGFFAYVEDQARQLGVENYSLYGLAFTIQLAFKTKPQAAQRFPVLAISPDVDLVAFFLAQRENLDRMGAAPMKQIAAVALTDAEMRDPETIASDLAAISGPVAKPANTEPEDVADAEVVAVDPSILTPEAVARILKIAEGRGLHPEALDRLLGGPLAEAPPSAELDILRRIQEYRA